MNSKRDLASVFRTAFPILSAAVYVMVFAVIFDTFNLDLFSAFYNILLALPLFGIILVLTRRFQIATTLATAVVFALFYVDQYVFSARLTHIRFSDLKLASQAVRVANRYPLIWNNDIARKLLIAATICALLIFTYRYYKLKYSWKPPFFTGLIMVIVSSAVIVSGIVPSSTEGFDFNSDAEQRGLLYSWYCQEKESHLEEPTGYSRESAQAILSQYNAIEGSNDVNVVVIMNESLADYSLIGTPRFDDPLPFIHGLHNNCFEGRLVVSVFGGGTANTEYEFLTGNSLAFLPKDCTPYLQYVDGPENNLTSELKDAGYTTTAIHPYYSEEWNRSQVYQFFGFDQFISGVDFGSTIVGNGESATATVPDNLMSFGDGPLYVRGLISDQTSFERVIEEGDGTTGQSFIFNVTMQNHGGYDYSGDDFANDPYVTEAAREEWTGQTSLNGMLYGVSSGSVSEEVYKVNQYLTLSNLSDKAFEYLIEELEKSDKKTIVLMFGDHQPGAMISEHYVDADEGVDLDYTVPYILWANYDVEFDAPTAMSPNYLSAVLKKSAGLGLTAWDQFRLDMLEEYPVMTANMILDKNGVVVSKDKAKDYAYVQYSRMFVAP